MMRPLTLKRQLRTRMRRQSGSVLVELALVLPLLFLLVLGTADFGRVFHRSIAVTNAARAGAQYALFEHYADVAGIKDAAVQDANISDFKVENVSADVRCECPGGPVACAAAYGTCGAAAKIWTVVDTNYQFTTLVDWPGIPHTVTLTGHAEMRAR